LGENKPVGGKEVNVCGKGGRAQNREKLVTAPEGKRPKTQQGAIMRRSFSPGDQKKRMVEETVEREIPLKQIHG